MDLVNLTRIKRWERYSSPVNQCPTVDLLVQTAQLNSPH